MIGAGGIHGGDFPERDVYERYARVFRGKIGKIILGRRAFGRGC